MITAGIDIGSLSANVVILSDTELLSTHSIRTGADSAGAAWRVMKEALKIANDKSKKLLLKDINYIVATGYGRVIVPFCDTTVTEISCHARGNHWLFRRME